MGEYDTTDRQTDRQTCRCRTNDFACRRCRDQPSDSLLAYYTAMLLYTYSVELTLSSSKHKSAIPLDSSSHPNPSLGEFISHMSPYFTSSQLTSLSTSGGGCGVG